MRFLFWIMLLAFALSPAALDALAEDAPRHTTQMWEFGQRAYLCDEHAKLIEKFTSPPYNEALTWWAINSENRGIFGLVNHEVGTWTVLRQRPDGLSCVVGHGSDFQMMTPGKDS